MKTTFRHVPQLDGVRGIAAFLVFCYHFFLPYTFTGAGASPLAREIVMSSKAGAYGVDIFFVLSGFLITSLLIKDRSRSNYFHNFYWKRALRLLPVLLLHLVIAKQLLPHFWPYALTSFLFIANFNQMLHIEEIGPTWTLAIEEQFYLVWPAVVRRCQPLTLYRIAIGGVLFSLTARAVVKTFAGEPYLHLTMYRIDGLFLGALLGLQWMEVPYREDRFVSAALSFLNHRITLVVALVVIFYFSVAHKLPVLSQFTLIAYLTYRLIAYVAPSTKRLAFLNNPVLTYMGNISYGLYMYHLLLFWAYDRSIAVTPLADRRAVMVRFGITTAASLAVATASRYAMELPVERLRRFVLRPGDLAPHDTRA